MGLGFLSVFLSTPRIVIAKFSNSAPQSALLLELLLQTRRTLMILHVSSHNGGDCMHLAKFLRQRPKLEHLVRVSSPAKLTLLIWYLSVGWPKSSLEIICGIIAACLPAIRPLLKTDLIKSYFSKSSSSRPYAVQEDAPHDLHEFGSSSNLQNTQSTSWSKNSKNRTRVDYHSPHPYTPGIRKTTQINLSTHTGKLEQDPRGNNPFVWNVTPKAKIIAGGYCYDKHIHSELSKW